MRVDHRAELLSSRFFLLHNSSGDRYQRTQKVNSQTVFAEGRRRSEKMRACDTVTGQKAAFAQCRDYCGWVRLKKSSPCRLCWW